MENLWKEELVNDDLLRMMFACCGEGNSAEVQVALILKLLCGFGVSEIAAAFLASSAAIEKQLSRGKQILAEGGDLAEVTALAIKERLAPESAPWIHDVEGPDDMPAHVKAMLNGVSLHVPVTQGKLALGTWQGIYLVEHRRKAHSREIVLQFIGSRV